MKYAALTLLLILISTNAHSFTLASSTDPNMQGWQNPHVQFVVNEASCPSSYNVAALIGSAGKVWNEIATSRVKVSYGGTTNSATLSMPPITVYCESNFNAATGADEDSTAGLAYVDASNGRLQSALIVLNSSTGDASITKMNADVLKTVVAHEIGHVLGLGHSEDSTALMYYQSGNEVRLTLAQDDVDGMTYLYPRNELGGDKMFGCATVKNISPPRPPHQIAFLLLIVLLPLMFAAAMKNSVRFRI